MSTISKVNANLRANIQNNNTPRMKIIGGVLHYYTTTWVPINTGSTVFEQGLNEEDVAKWELFVISLGDWPVLCMVEVL